MFVHTPSSPNSSLLNPQPSPTPKTLLSLLPNPYLMPPLLRLPAFLDKKDLLLSNLSVKQAKSKRDNRRVERFSWLYSRCVVTGPHKTGRGVPRLFVETPKGRILAVSLVENDFFQHKRSNIIYFFVRKNARRKGVASLLMERTISFAKAHRPRKNKARLEEITIRATIPEWSEEERSRLLTKFGFEKGDSQSDFVLHV